VTPHQTLAVVVPTYRGGPCLWLGIAAAARWHHGGLGLLRIVVVDDASPGCAFTEGRARVGDVEVVFLVNADNQGQSQTTWRGLGVAGADWIVLLEDDLVGWPATLTAIAHHLAPAVDLVSVARPPAAAGRTRHGAQPLVRRLFRWAGAGDLVDPTSPIKALRTSAFPPAVLRPWRDALHEGLVVLSRSTREVVATQLAWDGRPSRYTTGARLRVGLHLWPRILRRALGAHGPERP
jgi:hypothetical protein